MRHRSQRVSVVINNHNYARFVGAAIESALAQTQAKSMSSPDALLTSLAPLYGQIRCTRTPLGSYRLHESNKYARLDFERRLAKDLLTLEHRCATVAEHCRRLGLDVEPDAWLEGSWTHQVARGVDELDAVLDQGATAILADACSWGFDPVTRGRRYLPFREHDGLFWGLPADDTEALAELERLRTAGARYFVLSSTLFWFEQQLPQLMRTLEDRFRKLFANQRMVVFELEG